MSSRIRNRYISWFFKTLLLTQTLDICCQAMPPFHHIGTYTKRLCRQLEFHSVHTSIRNLVAVEVLETHSGQYFQIGGGIDRRIQSYIYSNIYYTYLAFGLDLVNHIIAIIDSYY